ncbi:MAG: amidohydrolase family protein [Candidatus Cloacimonetes bacterium]|nr:amidohydrolase family protein [Candidatus Cloacimonadota bacterium]
MHADLIINMDTILTMDKDLRQLDDHQIVVKDGRIIDLCPQEEKRWTASKTLDGTDCIAIPGLINTHSHLPMSYFRGLADDLPLDIWLREYIWPMEAKTLNSSVIHDAALHGAAEMLKNGITMTHDMYFEMPAIADACTKAGLRALIGEAIISARLAEGQKPGDQLRILRQEYRDNPLVDFNLSPHSIYACLRSDLETSVEVAQELDLLLHIHLSETKEEVQTCLNKRGMRPVQYLKELGMLEIPLLIAHGIWMDESEMDLLVGTRASIASCTDSNLKLASGIAPLKGWTDKGINFAIATDGVASNNDLDILAELGNTARLHKAINEDPSFLPAAEALKHVTINAARALGVEESRGSLEIGKDADICILDHNSLCCQPLYNPYSHIVYAMNGRNVRDVVVGGKIVVQGGKLTQVDEAELIAKAKHYGKRILKELSQ